MIGRVPEGALHQNIEHVVVLIHGAPQVIQVESVLQPDPMADDFAGKAMILVTLGISGRDHIG